jgi:hypothetical protein
MQVLILKQYETHQSPHPTACWSNGGNILHYSGALKYIGLSSQLTFEFYKPSKVFYKAKNIDLRLFD